jgi:AraC family transcriptional regulator
MVFEFRAMTEGDREQIAAFDTRRSALHVVLGSGRSCVLYGKAAQVTVLVPLKGRLQLSEGDAAYALAPGQLLVVEAGQDIQLIGRGPVLWVAILASARAWRDLIGADLATHAPDPVLLPGTQGADRLLRSGVIALARAMRDRRRDATAIHAAAASVATGISDQQRAFDRLIERCAGRTLAQRRSVFVRLQRVRNRMVAGCHRELDLADCARIASYSPCHFIRAFSAVYGETPHALLVEQRLQRARRLLNDSVLAVTEVARISGFEDRCAFARSFKRRFGISASGLRGALHESLPAVA